MQEWCEHRQTVDPGDAQRGYFRVATDDFADHDRRDELLEVIAVKFPPLDGRCLISGDADIPARARGEVAGDGGFEVKARLHSVFGQGIAFVMAASISAAVW